MAACFLKKQRTPLNEAGFSFCSRNDVGQTTLQPRKRPIRSSTHTLRWILHDAPSVSSPRSNLLVTFNNLIISPGMGESQENISLGKTSKNVRRCTPGSPRIAQPKRGKPRLRNKRCIRRKRLSFQSFYHLNCDRKSTRRTKLRRFTF